MGAVNGPLVTVTAYPMRDAARTAKRALDVAGIDSLVDEPAEDRVRLRVENVDALRAGDVLTRTCDTLPEIDEADEEARENLCPACSSADAAPSHRGRSFLLIAVLAIAVGTGAQVVQATFFAVAAAGIFQLVSGRWRCNACGETWD
jgi:hypothetical protein